MHEAKKPHGDLDHKPTVMAHCLASDGAVPEWLGSGLQNRPHRFDSGRHLQLLRGAKEALLQRASMTQTVQQGLEVWQTKGRSPPCGGLLPAVLNNSEHLERPQAALLARGFNDSNCSART